MKYATVQLLVSIYSYAGLTMLFTGIFFLIFTNSPPSTLLAILGLMFTLHSWMMNQKIGSVRLSSGNMK